MADASLHRRISTLSFANRPEAEQVWGSITTYPGLVESRYDVHFELELGVVLEGRMRRWWAGHERELRPGMAWLCGAWETHGYAVGGEGCRVMVLVLRPQALSALVLPEAEGLDWLACFREAPSTRPQVATVDRDEARRISERLAAAQPADARESRLRCRLVAIELLGLLLLRGWRATDPATPGGTGDHDLASRAMGLLLERHGALTMSAAAAACGLGRNAFARRFERSVGIGFAACAADAGLRGAADELAGGEEPVKAIARRWGFTDASHLGRVFARRYGCTPVGYRAYKRG
jgi:AraC-like DNA-binding protein